MNILISGASGFIGKMLVNHLSSQHNITVLGRNLQKLKKSFSPSISQLTFENLMQHNASNYNLIIHLSGANISAKRWNKSFKKELIESRLSTTEQLIQWLIQQKAKPRFFCASAVGIYGTQNMSTDECWDEYSSIQIIPNDFTQQICLAWEQSLQAAVKASIQVTNLRFGVVLKKGFGILKKMELPFRLGLGSILGEGMQGFSWVHHEDLVRAISFLIDHPEITGPVNITAPNPINQKGFAIQFSKALKKNLFFKTPSWMISLLFGEMGKYLLLKGQKALPKRLTEKGFYFIHPKIDEALAQEYTHVN